MEAGEENEWLVRALLPARTEEAVDHHQNSSYVQEVGTSPLRSSLCTPLNVVSTVVRIRVTKTNVRSTAVGE